MNERMNMEFCGMILTERELISVLQISCELTWEQT